MESIIAEQGLYFKGAIVFGEGINFSIFSKNATEAYIDLYEDADALEPSYSYRLHPQKNRTGDTWHVFLKGVKPGIYYTWRLNGPCDLPSGHKFDINRPLLDPYAKAITPNLENGVPRKGQVMDGARLNANKIVRRQRNFKELIIYEMHIKLLTMNENSGVVERGSYLGAIEKIPYLKELGINAVELLPIFEFNENDVIGRNPFTGEALKNVWGYNPISFYAPTANYLSGDRVDGAKKGQQVEEFKELVKAFHEADIEVILDVVFNHTGEGNEHGPVISFKGIDNTIYYMLEKDPHFYSNYSGTGNTLNCSHPVVKELILDSLRFWYGQMNVDGFRFDLAAILGRGNDGDWMGSTSVLNDIVNDSVLSTAILIAEGWDAAGGYFLGEFPEGWAEWNGKYRDTVRQFIKGDKGQVSDLATRIMGSPDLFSKKNRKPYHSVNFVTAHDGFTMWDLVSYNEKHNEANGENNNDGESHNNSWNHGIEGHSDDPEIIKLRKKQIKNFMVMLMVSQGVPMILMGDELGKTQNGNNNTYCQDNELNWIDWSLLEKNKDLFYFVKKMILFRKQHPALTREHFYTASDIDGNGITDISWHGIKAYKPDWSYDSRVLAFMIDGSDTLDGDTRDNDIYVAFNSYYESLEFELPVLNDKDWYLVVDTDLEEGCLETHQKTTSSCYTVQSRSSVIFLSKKRKS